MQELRHLDSQTSSLEGATINCTWVPLDFTGLREITKEGQEVDREADSRPSLRKFSSWRYKKKLS